VTDEFFAKLHAHITPRPNFLLSYKLAMTGAQARNLRQVLGLKQTRVAWDVGVDGSLLSRWELGVYKLRPELVALISAYLRQKLNATKVQLNEWESLGEQKELVQSTT
jgi:DNA-binding transcriptional regulator YiaG